MTRLKEGRTKAEGRQKPLRSMDTRERDVLRLAVLAMAEGRTPTAQWLSQDTHLSIGVVRQALAALEACDCVALDGDRVRVAYPFTTDPVAHEVVSSHGTARANCIVDALGTGAMLGEEVEIRSRCPQCGTSIRLRGKEGFAGTLPDPVVFLPPLERTQSHAADCICPAINLYCNEEHGRAHLGPLAERGRFLTLNEATDMGIGTFAALLGSTSNQPEPQPPSRKG